MMEFIKRKLTRPINFLLLLTIINSCNFNSKKEDQLLDCILNNYIKDSNLSKGDIISMNYKIKWTDSTSIAVISNDRFKGNKEKDLFFSSSFNDIKIYLLINNQKGVDDGKSSLNFLIPNNLVWKVKKSDVNKKIDYKLNDYEELNSIQVIYNLDKKCIQEIIVGPKNLINNIYESCNICNSAPASL